MKHMPARLRADTAARSAPRQYLLTAQINWVIMHQAMVRPVRRTAGRFTIKGAAIQKMISIFKDEGLQKSNIASMYSSASIAMILTELQV